MPRRASRRPAPTIRPGVEVCEARLLLSVARPIHVPPAAVRPLFMPGFEHPTRPNTPVLPYGQAAGATSFLDPSVRIFAGEQISVGPRSYFAPYAMLDARGGLIKFGRLSTLGDNATLQANPGGTHALTAIEVGDAVLIGPGATVRGPSLIGGYDIAAAPTYVGANAVLDGASVAPGGFVMPLAYVGPGVIVPAGHKVLPGAVVLTQAEADDPAAGKVALVTEADRAGLIRDLAEAERLAAGYTTLYQGNRATGQSPGTMNSNVANGSLPAVTGISREPVRPGAPTPARVATPRFLGRRGLLTPSALPNYPARVIGGVIVPLTPAQFAHRIGRSVSIRGDLGQPLAFGTIDRFGSFVSIQAPLGGRLTVGDGLNLGDRVVLIGGPRAVIGDGVTIGPGAVVEDAAIGSGSVVGTNAYVRGVTLPPGTVVPAGAVLIGGA